MLAVTYSCDIDDKGGKIILATLLRWVMTLLLYTCNTSSTMAFAITHVVYLLNVIEIALSYWNNISEEEKKFSDMRPQLLFFTKI